MQTTKPGQRHDLGVTSWLRAWSAMGRIFFQSEMSSVEVVIAELASIDPSRSSVALIFAVLRLRAVGAGPDSPAGDHVASNKKTAETYRTGAQT